MSIEYTEAMIDDLYSVYDHESGRNVGYHRDAFMKNPDGGMFRRRARILSPLIAPDAKTVLVIGMGLGCLNEALMEVRPELLIYGIDPAPYVLARADEMERDVRSLWLPLDATYRYAKKKMRDAWGVDRFDVVITEDVLSGYEMDEAPDFLRAAGRYSKTVMHWVSVGDPRPSSIVNYRPLVEWVALWPTHTWVGNDGTVVTP